MKKPSKIIKAQLMSIIRKMNDSPELFVKNPGRDFTRRRKLSFEKMMLLLLTMGGGSLQTELYKHEGYTAHAPTSSAFIQQRDKLKPFALEYMLHEFAIPSAKAKHYKGYRLLAVDGSDLHTPTNPNEIDNFFQGHPGEKGYNLMHLNALYDLYNQIYVDAMLQNRRCANEHKALTSMVDRSPIGRALLIADRGYESYNNLAHIEQKGWKYLIRIKDVGAKTGMLTGLELPKSSDFDVCIKRILTRKQTKEVKDKLYRFMPTNSTFDFFDYDQYYPLSFRIVRFKIADDTFETIITNLSTEQFPSDELKNLYKMRWGIETAFRSLKYAVGLVCLHSKKAEHISQEVFAALIMYNFTEMIATQVIIQYKDTQYEYQINFAFTVHVCKRVLNTCEMAHPPDIEALILANTLPVRNGRCFPRKVRFRQAVSFNYRIS